MWKEVRDWTQLVTARSVTLTFLDVDDKRQLACVSAVVDEGNVVVFGQQDSYIENTIMGQRIPMSGRKGVFVVRLDAKVGEEGGTDSKRKAECGYDEDDGKWMRTVEEEGGNLLVKTGASRGKEGI